MLLFFSSDFYSKSIYGILNPNANTNIKCISTYYNKILSYILIHRKGEKTMSDQNLTLLTDLYELTMMQGYFETQENDTVVFDVFFRNNPNKGGYSVMAGLQQ